MTVYDFQFSQHPTLQLLRSLLVIEIFTFSPTLLNNNVPVVHRKEVEEPPFSQYITLSLEVQNATITVDPSQTQTFFFSRESFRFPSVVKTLVFRDSIFFSFQNSSKSAS